MYLFIKTDGCEGGDGGTRKKGNWLLTESYFSRLEWRSSYKFIKGRGWTRQALKIHFIFINYSWYVRWDYNPEQWSCFFLQYWWYICTHPSTPLHKSSWAATTPTHCSKPPLQVEYLTFQLGLWRKWEKYIKLMWCLPFPESGGGGEVWAGIWLFLIQIQLGPFKWVMDNAAFSSSSIRPIPAQPRLLD